MTSPVQVRIDSSDASVLCMNATNPKTHLCNMAKVSDPCHGDDQDIFSSRDQLVSYHVHVALCDMPEVSDLPLTSNQEIFISSVQPVSDQFSGSNSGTIDCANWTAESNGLKEANCSAEAHCVNDPYRPIFSSADPTGCESVYRMSPIIPRHPPLDVRTLPRHTIGGIPSQMIISTWDYYLSFEDDLSKSAHLRDGILHGFPIVDEVDIPPCFCENYSSVMQGEAFTFVDKLIDSEVQDGKYVLASSILSFLTILNLILPLI